MWCVINISITRNILKFVLQKQCILLLTKHDFKLVRTINFQLLSGCGTVEISFEARLIHVELPSELIFAQSVLKTMSLSSLAYGVVCIKKRLTYNELRVNIKT